MAERTLVLLRHAKSDYPDGVPDELRPLSARGERDAPAAAEVLRAAPPDLVLCSPAVRARRTWELVEAALGEVSTVRYEPALYAASARAVLGLARSAPAEVSRLLVVGHNPGLEELAGELAQRGDKAARKALAAKFPTSAMAVFRVTGDWDRLGPDTAELVAVHVPRG